MKICFSVIFSLLSLLLSSEQWQVASIIDIGKAEHLLYRGVGVTCIGAFDLTNFNDTLHLFNGNMKSVDSDEEFLTALTYDNVIKIYRLSGAFVEYLYSIPLPYKAERVIISEGMLLIKTQNADYLKLIDTLNAENVFNYNISNLDFIVKNGSQVAALRNRGEMVTYGYLNDTDFVLKNSIFTDSATFFLLNSFGNYFSNSSKGKIVFYGVSNDSLRKLIETDSPREYMNGYDLDSLFALSSLDSVFIFEFTDALNMICIDSFEMKEGLNDIILNNDTLYILSKDKVLRRSLYSSSYSSFIYSKQIKSVLSDTNNFIMFSEDTVFIFDSIFSDEYEKQGFLFAKNSYGVYEDSTVLLVTADSIIDIKNPVIPSGLFLISDSLFISSKNSIIYCRNTSDSQYSVLSVQSFPIYDLCRDSDNIYTASGFYGVCRTDYSGIKQSGFGESSHVQNVYSFNNKIYAALENHSIIEIDENLDISDTLFSGNFNKASVTCTGFLINTDDSIIKIDSATTIIQPMMNDYKGISETAVLDTSALLVLKGGSVILLNRNITYKREQTNEIQRNNFNKERNLLFDICGRNCKNEVDFMRTGIYFLYDGEKQTFKKIVKLK